MVILLNGFFLFFSLTSVGQPLQDATVTGKVIDSSTGMPLAFASIYLRSAMIGTVSNANGDFELKIARAHRSDSLTISHVGYRELRVALTDRLPPAFALVQYATLLDEVEVRDFTAETVVKKALRLIPKNYPATPFIAKAFFRDWKMRESVTPDSSYVSLLEAAVAIDDEGYGRKSRREEKVFLEEIRRTLTPGPPYNYLHLLLRLNFVRHQKSRNTGNIISPFDTKLLVDHSIEKIKAGTRDLYLVTMWLPEKNGKYELYITVDTLAFVMISFKGEMNDKPLGIDRTRKGGLTHHLTMVDNTVMFRERNNLYYLDFMTTRWKTRTFIDSTHLQTDTREMAQELLINEIITENVEAIRAGLLYPMTIDASLDNQTRVYNESFWKEFNTVKQTNLDEEVTNRINRRKAEHEFRLPKNK